MATVINQHQAGNLHPIVGDRVIEGTGTAVQDWQAWQGLATLPSLKLASHFPVSRRVCVFAPHPDDEILGCGGLLQQLVEQGNQVLLVSVTQGEKSHPDSKLYPPAKLAQVRELESQLALATLGTGLELPTVKKHALALPDGDVFAHQADFFAKLKTLIAPHDILVTTFVHDGHPDHEATGQVVQRFVDTYQAALHLSCYQVLIWAWHWAAPADQRIPWHHALRLDMTELQLQLKTQAMRCFTSQLQPDPTTGQSPVLAPTTLARLSQPFEVYVYNE